MLIFTLRCYTGSQRHVHIGTEYSYFPLVIAAILGLGSPKLPLLMSKAIYIATPGQQEVPPDFWIYHIGNLLLIRLEVPAGENKPAKIRCYLHKLLYS